MALVAGLGHDDEDVEDVGMDAPMVQPRVAGHGAVIAVVDPGGCMGQWGSAHEASQWCSQAGVLDPVGF